MRRRRSVAVLGTLALITTAAAVADNDDFVINGDDFVINGKVLSGEEMRTIRRLERMYRTKAIPGRYWYDARSGLWGIEGQPPAGMLPPGLRLGGPLSPKASGGNTPVWVNGRQLSRQEVQYLSQCTAVRPGRYWMDSQGNGGYVGQPASFNIVALCRRNATRLNGTPGNRGWYGHVSGGGGTVGAVFSDGAGVTCGPDGGCIY